MTIEIVDPPRKREFRYSGEGSTGEHGAYDRDCGRILRPNHTAKVRGIRNTLLTSDVTRLDRTTRVDSTEIRARFDRLKLSSRLCINVKSRFDRRFRENESALSLDSHRFAENEL